MMSRKIKEADLDCELRYIATLQETVETGECEVTVLDCNTDRYMREKTMNKHGFIRRYAMLSHAIMCIKLALGEHSELEDLGEIFGFHMYHLCIYNM